MFDLKGKIIGILVILLLGCIVSFFIMKGIVINKDYHYDQRQDQRQFQTQAQLNIYGYIIQGKKVQIKGESFKTFSELINKLNELPPFISWPDWGFNCETKTYDITYIEFIEEKK